MKHYQDYLYFLYEGENKLKEMVVSANYLLMFDNKDKQARYQPVNNTVILRKIKGPGKNKAMAGDEYTIVRRKPLVSEATLKSNLLKRMGVALS